MAECARPGKTRPVRQDVLAVIVVPLVALATATGARADDTSWLRVDAPAALESAAQLPFVEVRGQAAARGARIHEFVIVIDVSASTALPSGWDVDGDGASGRTDAALLARLLAKPDLPAGLAERLRDADFDDSVLAAELTATRALLARLETGTRYRVGLVAFSDQARLLAPVGSRRGALVDAFAALRENFHRHLGGSNFGDAIAAAQLALQPESNGAAAAPPAGTDQSILFLSDGEPTLPPHGDRARQHALYAASAAGAAGIRIFAFDLSREQKTSAGVLAEMAARSDGRLEVLDRPGDAIARLRRTDLAGLAELRIVNETTGAAARALRTFPDGSFDAFVEVAPGRNHIVLRAATATGAHAGAERWIVRDAGASASPGEAAALVQELRKRTRETELWAEMERERRTQNLDIELRIEVEPTDAVEPAPAAGPQVLPR
jgi:hypothetical protein